MVSATEHIVIVVINVTLEGLNITLDLHNPCVSLGYFDRVRDSSPGGLGGLKFKPCVLIGCLGRRTLNSGSILQCPRNPTTSRPEHLNASTSRRKHIGTHKDAASCKESKGR